MINENKQVILAIDDDPVILSIVLSTLKDDYSVRPFTGGRAALKFLAGQPADLILLDFQMPEINGFEVLAQLQEDPRLQEIPVVFLTGNSDGDAEVRALEMGAVDYIHKPVKPRALLTRVRLQLELQSHRRHLEALVAEKTRSLNEAYTKLKVREDVTLNLLARVTDLRDHDTGDHIARTTRLVTIIINDLMAGPREGYILSEAEAGDIIRSAKLHDLGKIATPDHILLKNGRLSPEEFEIIKLHPVHGERLLSDFIRQMDDSFLKIARDIAFGHHEKWDGSGYPLGLKGREIPLAARVVAIADVYDALRSARPYKEPLGHEESMAIIRQSSGSHFDPCLVEAFLRHDRDVAEAGDMVSDQNWSG